MTVTVSVVRTLTDYAMAHAIRSAVYIAEQDCPYLEEFDGNDFSGTLLIAKVDDEPVACMRIRYFAKFVKFERLAVISTHRGRGAARKIVQFGFEICERKGFTHFYIHAQERLVSFWGGFGFEVLDVNRTLAFSDHQYVEMSCERAQSTNVLSLENDPLIINRPEGEWGRMGVLDHSSSRLPTNPHAKERTEEELYGKATKDILKALYVM